LGLGEWFEGFLVTLLSYSHLIPISLYVAVEALKVILVWQINKQVIVNPDELVDNHYKPQLAIPDKKSKVNLKKLNKADQAEKDIEDAKKAAKAKEALKKIKRI
jgi:diketogulonate reductase-like aldo/keto reductase